jgi:hypothetical protein
MIEMLPGASVIFVGEFIVEASQSRVASTGRATRHRHLPKDVLKSGLLPQNPQIMSLFVSVLYLIFESDV